VIPEELSWRLTQYLDAGLHVTARNGHAIVLTPFTFPTGEAIEFAIHGDDGKLVLADMGTTDGFLAERGLSWHSTEIARAAATLFELGQIDCENGELTAHANETNLVGRIMDFSQACLWIAGAAYARPPVMPEIDESRTRKRVATRFQDLADRRGFAKDIDWDAEFSGKSGQRINVPILKDRPLLIFLETLKSDEMRRARAIAFEWLDIDANGVPDGATATCIYDPPSSGANGDLQAATGHILATYFTDGVYSIEDETPITQALRRAS
jgi:hypothetical protein